MNDILDFIKSPQTLAEIMEEMSDDFDFTPKSEAMGRTPHERVARNV